MKLSTESSCSLLTTHRITFFGRMIRGPCSFFEFFWPDSGQHIPVRLWRVYVLVVLARSGEARSRSSSCSVICLSPASTPIGYGHADQQAKGTDFRAGRPCFAGQLLGV